MSPSIAVRADVPLAPLCTLGIGGVAQHFVAASDEDQVREAFAWARVRKLPVTVLGGGSNVVIRDRGIAGLVVQMAMRGAQADVRADRARVTLAAGEPWDACVASAVANGWAGIECLSGIPGTAGATPIQNVGAYGQDVAETVESVRVLDRDTLDVRTLTNAECAFAYRDSAFKREQGAAANTVVLSVTLALRVAGASTVRYPELARALETRGADRASIRDVRETVIELRRGKSMVIEANDPNRRSVGSFFTNPIVSAEQAGEVVARALAAGIVSEASAVPRYDAAPGQVKLAAAWLIERAGFGKGMRQGNVGISSRHALALVNHGGATCDELLALAATIRSGVQSRFGVVLSMEPVILGDAR